MPDVRVTVVDNASPDDSLDDARGPRRGSRSARRATAASPTAATSAPRAAQAPYLLFLNPDARIDADGAGGPPGGARRATRPPGSSRPRILDEDGALAWSIRRFPRQRSTFAQALFLHRLWPRAAWTDELVREPAAYERPGTPDWVSGACMLVRREAFEAVGGLRRGLLPLLRGHRHLPQALGRRPARCASSRRRWSRHVGGASSGAGETQAIAARSRVLYARKHMGPAGARLQALGVALGEATHAAASLPRPASRRGHMAALRAASRPGRAADAAPRPSR